MSLTGTEHWYIFDAFVKDNEKEMMRCIGNDWRNTEIVKEVTCERQKHML